MSENNSRREFIKLSSMAGAGIAFTIGPSLLNANNPATAKIVADEPIIDIHQHTNYLGRTDNKLLTHQRNMGVTTTILLPAGHPVDYGSTYYGVGNGLQAEATANEACYKLANQFPNAVSYTHLRAHETPEHLVCRL